MTQTAIKTQVEAIKKATAMALQSKETAKQFLIDAGILKPTTAPANQRKHSK